MKKIAKKSKDAIFFVVSPEGLVLGILSVLFWGGQIALLVYAIVKIVNIASG